MPFTMEGSGQKSGIMMGTDMCSSRIVYLPRYRSSGEEVVVLPDTPMPSSSVTTRQSPRWSAAGLFSRRLLVLVSLAFDCLVVLLKLCFAGLVLYLEIFNASEKKYHLLSFLFRN
jgi:hypothetical protein